MWIRLTPRTKEVECIASEADNIGALFWWWMLIVVAVDKGLGCESREDCKLVSTVRILPSGVPFWILTNLLLLLLLCLGTDGVGGRSDGLFWLKLTMSNFCSVWIFISVGCGVFAGSFSVFFCFVGLEVFSFSSSWLCPFFSFFDFLLFFLLEIMKLWWKFSSNSTYFFSLNRPNIFEYN